MSDPGAQEHANVTETPPPKLNGAGGEPPTNSAAQAAAGQANAATQGSADAAPSAKSVQPETTADAAAAAAMTAAEKHPGQTAGAQTNGATRPDASSVSASHTGQTASFKVAQIVKGGLDARGETIDKIFFRRESYAIYHSDGKVMVQYADTDKDAKEQIARIAELIPARDRLQYLLKDIAAPDCCYGQIAEALRLGLEGEPRCAREILDIAIQDIIATRVRRGRLYYFCYAGLLATGASVLSIVLGAIALIAFGGAPAQKVASGLGHLLLATGAGAVGALLFSSIALKNRTVATDGDVHQNAMDSAVRVMIGVISAGVLYLLLASGILPTIAIGDLKLNANGITWQVALVIGFAAGYLERLVPDLLEKKTPPTPAPDVKQAPPPLPK